MIPRGRGIGRGKLILELLGDGSRPKPECPGICKSTSETPSLPAPQVGRGRGKLMQKLREMRLRTEKEKEINEVSTLNKESMPTAVSCFNNETTRDQTKEKEINEVSTLNKESMPTAVSCFNNETTRDQTKEKEINEVYTLNKVSMPTAVSCFNNETTQDQTKEKEINEVSTLNKESMPTAVSCFKNETTQDQTKEKEINEVSTLNKESMPTAVSCFNNETTRDQTKEKEINEVSTLNKESMPTAVSCFNNETTRDQTKEKEINEVSSLNKESMPTAVSCFKNETTQDQTKEKEINEVSTLNKESMPTAVSCFNNETTKVKAREKEINEVSTLNKESMPTAVSCFNNETTRDQTKVLEEKLRWFNLTNNKAVSLEYLNRLLTEPVGDTETFIDSFSPAQIQIRRYNIELARVQVLLDRGRIIEITKILSTILNTNDKIPREAMEFEKEIINCYIFWFNAIRTHLLSPENETLSHPPTTPSNWANSYVKAAFHQLFSTKGCRRALAGLLCIGLEDDPSMQNLELLFLKARILGKLRYLEQWPASRWQEEETLLLHVIRHLQPMSTKWAARAQVYMAEFLRLRGYRRFLEIKEYVGTDAKIDHDYKRSRDLLISLEKPLTELHLVEAMAWRAEQLFKMPSKGDWDDIYLELAEKSLWIASSKGSYITENAYCLRIMALAHEKTINKHNREKMAEQQRWGQKFDNKEDDVAIEKKRDALEQLDAAIQKGSSMAQLERAGLLFRLDRSRDMLPVLQGLPDAGLHIAAYLVLCKNNIGEAQHHLQPFLKDLDMYPPLLVHYPICTPLHEPINLAHVVFSDPGNSAFLKTRKEVLDEATRLKTNKKFRSKTNNRQKNQRNAYPYRN